MKKLICEMVVLILCLCTISATAEAILDGEAELGGDVSISMPNATIGSQEPSSSPAPTDTKATSSTGAAHWSYPVSMTALHSPYVLLVNKSMPLEKSYVPDPLIKVKGVKRATSADIYLEEKTAQALESMFEAAKLVREYNYISVNSKGVETEKVAQYDDRGMVLYLKSGYRSYGTQMTTYTNRLASNNNVDNGFVAKPGESEHQTGYSADILNADYAGRPRMTQDFKWTPEAQWMKENCAEFGFILRFLEDKEEETGIHFEPWHFRYVGKEAAGYIMANDICLEEFTDEWQLLSAEFVSEGGDVDQQIVYEQQRQNAPLESVILDEYGEDGDMEVSLLF